MYTPDPARSPLPPGKEEMAKMGQFMAESIKSGILVSTGGLLPVSQGGARVRSTSGQVAMVDGPFAEAKEVIAGWAILEAKSREHVVEITRQFLAIAGDGECEIRQIMDPSQGEQTCAS
jgi:hypothetical protein